MPSFSTAPDPRQGSVMRIGIFNVAHGACSLISCPNGTCIVIDCGLNLDPPWFPSLAFRGRFINLLAFNNLDEDHLEDLPYLWRNVPIGSIFSNPTVNAAALAAMKREHGMRDGVQTAHAILQHLGSGLIGRPANLANVQAWAYWNRFVLDFTDTNNLSPAIFVRYGSFTILFAGDLETAGWRALLRIPSFIADLTSVTVFVASHHGRQNGQCQEIFRFCWPHVFIFSDEEHLYNSQDTTDWYAQRAQGIPDFRMAPISWLGHPRRYVLTTRRDGVMRIEVRPDGSYLIFPERPPTADSRRVLATAS